jgi:hypothetical protein
LGEFHTSGSVNGMISDRIETRSNASAAFEEHQRPFKRLGGG